jgi:hypothetical protein
MEWCKRDNRECIRDICSMRPQPKGLESYKDCPEFVIRGERSKLNFYYDDFECHTEELDEVLEVFLYKPIK